MPRRRLDVPEEERKRAGQVNLEARHWNWLHGHAAGASETLRGLIDREVEREKRRKGAETS